MYSKKTIFLIISAILMCFVSQSYAQRTRDGILRFNGRVIDANGQGVEKSLIYVLPNHETSGRNFATGYSVPVEETTRSYADGKYRLQFSPDSFHLVKSEEFDLYVRNIEQNLVAVKKFTEKDRAIEATTSPGITLSGTVVGTGNNPIPNASVSFTVGHSAGTCIYNFEQIERIHTDEAGRYEIKALWPDIQYIFSIKADSYGTQTISRYIDANTPDNSITLEPIVLKRWDVSVSGVVVDEYGGPVTDAIVVFSSQDLSDREIRTDSQGRFTAHNLPEGSIDIQVFNTNSSSALARMEVDNGIADLRIEISQANITNSLAQVGTSSLIGRTLPDLSEYGVELTEFDTTGRMILVCFFNIVETSSRNIMIQLSNSNQELRNKGVIVCGVQSSLVTQTALDAWVERNNLAVPVGMINRVNEEAQRLQFRLGIKSLPWLILTDRKRVVHSEGFSIYELDTRISLTDSQQ